MKNKKIENVVIVNDFNYIQGGASKVAIDTAKILSNNGIKVYFFSAVNKPEENIEGITYISTNQKEALIESNILKGATNGIYNFKAKKELKKLLKILDPQTTIIHVHGWTKALSSSIFDIAFKLKYKVVLTLHDYFTACPNGGYFNYKQNEICRLSPLSWKCIKCNCDSRNYRFKLYRILRQFVQNKIVRLNDKLKNVIAISNFSEKILKSTLGKNTKIIRIDNPIEIDKTTNIVNPAKNEYYLYVGRVSKEKGVDLFCEAITNLGYKGIVVGDGYQKAKLEKEYPNIEFTGWKSNDEVKGYMKGAKALIFPSRLYETAGLTPLEIMQYGIPCFVSNISAATEYIQNEKCKFNLTVEDLKNVIKKYDENINCYQEYLGYDIKQILNKEYKEEIIKTYKTILEE